MGAFLTALQLLPGLQEGIGARVWLFVLHSSPLNLVLTAKQGIRSCPLGNLHIKNVGVRNDPLRYIQHIAKGTVVAGFLVVALEKQMSSRKLTVVSFNCFP